MTAQMIAKDAAAMIAMTTDRPAPVVVSDPIIPRMDRTEADGVYDRGQDRLWQARYGDVGGERMMCQVAVLGPDTLITFWTLVDSHQRRLLVDGQGRTWMDTGRGVAVVIGQANKYNNVAGKIMAVRPN